MRRSGGDVDDVILCNRPRRSIPNAAAFGFTVGARLCIYDLSAGNQSRFPLGDEEDVVIVRVYLCSSARRSDGEFDCMGPVVTESRPAAA